MKRFAAIGVVTVMVSACTGELQRVPSTPAAGPVASPDSVATMPPPVEAAAPLPEGLIGDYLAGKVAEDDHDFPGAAQFLEQALQADPDNVELMLRVTICLAAEGQLAPSTAVARRLLAIDSGAFLAAFILAEQRAKAGDWPAVQQDVADLPKRGMTLLLIPVIEAWAEVGEGDIDAALERLKPVKGLAGMEAIYTFHVALINDLADRQAAAAAAYDETLGLQGGLTLRTTEAAAAFYRRIGQSDKALAVLQHFHNVHPEMIYTGEADGVRSVASAADGLAEAFFGTAESIRPGNAPELTLAFDRLALDLRPDFPLAQILLGETFQQAGKLQEANQIFAGLRPTSPFFGSGQLQIADNLDRLGQTDAAVQILNAVALRYPKRQEPLIKLGELLSRHKKWSEATAAFDRAIAMLGPPDRGQWYVYYARGIAEERNHQWTHAEADFLRALDMQPDEALVLNYLGYSWLERGMHLDQARKMIERAVQLRPQDGQIVDSMGWALYTMGQFGPAVDTLERAVELDPADATVNDHLGDALWRVGRQTEARFQWSHALLFSPEPDLQATLEKKLKSGLHSLPLPAAHGGGTGH